jgi:thymidylate synthase ThyX
MSYAILPEPMTQPISDSSSVNAPSVEVFAVYGVEPEVQAYAMAKYSRSALSMKESLKEITSQKAEKFLNTFYFQYGHRSIADLAHIALAIEKLSILAAIVIADESRWDGQERSTRYQDFKKSGYYTPRFRDDRGDGSVGLFHETIEALFAAYESVSQKIFAYLVSFTPRPAEMKQDAYERTLRARAFDVSRYLLPLATNTSLGEIVNARTLESQVSHLLAQPHRELRDLGALLKRAATSPAYNANEESLYALVEAIGALSPELAERAKRELLHEVRVAPTLVKYADPNAYEIESRRELQEAAADLMAGAAIDHVPLVDLLDSDPLEIELACTLIYANCQYPYTQIRRAVEAAGETRRREIIDIGLRHRGRHDELPRAFASGHQFRFDILMDIGGFRDMHRHRRCIQIMQDFTAAHGYETPPEIELAGLRAQYDDAMHRAEACVRKLAESGSFEAVENSQYTIPLAFRKRTLFKMDFAEVVYISELRTTPAGHISYRNVAYAMYEAVAKKYPAMAKYFRVVDVREPVDLLKR